MRAAREQPAMQCMLRMCCEFDRRRSAGWRLDSRLTADGWAGWNQGWVDGSGWHVLGLALSPPPCPPALAQSLAPFGVP